MIDEAVNQMPNEIWRSSSRFPSYQVSADGRVRRAKRYNNSSPDGSVRIGAYGKFGYRRVCLSEANKKYSVLLHRLVAETFLGRCPEGHVVNHIDANKSNNAIGNLEYVTPDQNVLHAKGLGRYRAWNKGIKTGIVPRSAFKLGNRPWNAELNK